MSIIAAHTSALNTLSVPPSGQLLATTSQRGTLIRIWNTNSGKLVRELRRGADKAEIYGVAFRPDEREVREDAEADERAREEREREERPDEEAV